jgi:RNA-directed DNA polymerase
MLMARVARRVKDKRLLSLIRRYLTSGSMYEGVVRVQEEGTPQGSPLSPLLSNILLDELDKELERRGHRFCRYADDCNIYVKSQKAGERVMESVTRFLEKRLRLKVNRDKSAVGRPWVRKFLGYSMTWHKKPKLKIAPASVQRLKSRIQELLRKGPDDGSLWICNHSLPAGSSILSWQRSRVPLNSWTSGCGESCAVSYGSNGRHRSPVQRG